MKDTRFLFIAVNQEIILGSILNLATTQAPDLAKSWFNMAGWCYKWGRKILDAAKWVTKLCIFQCNSVTWYWILNRVSYHVCSVWSWFYFNPLRKTTKMGYACFCPSYPFLCIVRRTCTTVCAVHCAIVIQCTLPCVLQCYEDGPTFALHIKFYIPQYLCITSVILDVIQTPVTGHLW